MNLKVAIADSDKCIGSVRETRNHSQFHLADENRPIKENKKLEQSIKKYGVLVPVVVTKDNVIEEGQHRWYYAQLHNMDLPYVKVDRTSAELASEINKVARKWALQDYLHKFSTQKKNSYVVFSNLIQESGLSPSTVHVLLKGTEIQKNEFESGRFTLTSENLERFNNLKAKVNDLLELNDGLFRKRLSKSRVMQSLAELISHPNYKHPYFVKKLTTLPSSHIKSVNSYIDAREMLEEIYNKNLRKDAKVSLETK